MSARAANVTRRPELCSPRHQPKLGLWDPPQVVVRVLVRG